MEEMALSKDMEILQAARNDLDYQQRLIKQQAKQEEVLKNAEKVLTFNKRQAAEQISKKIKESQEELQNFYEDKKNRKLEELKQIQTERQKEKDKGIQERIKEETQPLYTQKKELKKQRAELFKQNKVSSIWNSRLYYAFAMPSCLTDWILILAFLFVYLLILPLFLINQVFDFSGIWQLALMYVLLLAAFICVYMVLLNRIKVPHEQMFLNAQKLRKQERKKQKEIRKLIKGIEKDKNEDYYNLAHYDEKIREAREELQLIQEERERVLQEFEEQTKLRIAEEIRRENQERLLLLIDEKERAKVQLEEMQNQVTQWNQTMKERYFEILGENYMMEERIDALYDVLESGEAKTIEQAKQVVQAGSFLPKRDMQKEDIQKEDIQKEDIQNEDVE